MFERAKIAVFMLFAACSVGEVTGGATPDGGNGTGGGQTFNTQIAPLVMRCTGSTCHGGTTSPNLTSFMALGLPYKAKPGSTNILVTKGDHQNIMYFNATEKMQVAAWIDSLP